MKKLLVIFLPLFVFFTPILPVLGNEEFAPVIEPPDLPNSIESGEQIEPQVTIIRKEDKVIEEYRVNNNLYMIKITPVIGLPYYLIDHDGDGEIDFRRHELDDVLVPQWVLFTW